LCHAGWNYTGCSSCGLIYVQNWSSTCDRTYLDFYRVPSRTTKRWLLTASRSAVMVYTDQLPYSQKVGNVITRRSQGPFGVPSKTRYDCAQALRSKHPYRNQISHSPNRRGLLGREKINLNLIYLRFSPGLLHQPKEISELDTRIIIRVNESYRHFLLTNFDQQLTAP
jgi:hypothetical protein